MRKKVLHILPSNDLAGAENVAISMITNLSDSFECVYASPEGGIKNILETRGITYIPIRTFNITEIRKIIKEAKPDIIHAHDFKATIKCLFSCFSIPVISHIHQNPAWLRKITIRSFLFFLGCFKLRKIIAVSPAIKKTTLLSVFPFNRKTEVIKNIVDVNWIRRKAVVDNDAFDSYDLAFVGRFEDVKDPLRFIEIVFEVAKKIPELKVIMMGGGSLEEECIKAIKSKEMQDRIEIKGFLSNPYPIVKNSKILVMTSKSEGMPMVAIEALSLGTPVIVPQLTGIENIVDSSCGFICKSNSDFVSNIVALLQSNAAHAEMSMAGVRKAKVICNIELFKDQLKQVYDDAIHK